MRNLRFRCWYGGKMHDNSESMRLLYNECNGSTLNPKGVIFMQFTGLHDKDGKEIYEGDILMYIASNLSSMEVKFIDGCFVGVGPFNTLPLSEYISAQDFESVTVIGNIHEQQIS